MIVALSTLSLFMDHVYALFGKVWLYGEWIIAACSHSERTPVISAQTTVYLEFFCLVSLQGLVLKPGEQINSLPGLHSGGSGVWVWLPRLWWHKNSAYHPPEGASEFHIKDQSTHEF